MNEITTDAMMAQKQSNEENKRWLKNNPMRVGTKR